MHGPQSDRPVRSVRRSNYPNGDQWKAEETEKTSEKQKHTPDQ